MDDGITCGFDRTGSADVGTGSISCTLADSVARLTLALATPCTCFKARSTRATQEAQVMPSMGSETMLSATDGFIARSLARLSGSDSTQRNAERAAWGLDARRCVILATSFWSEP